jgi:hypothetical protein
MFAPTRRRDQAALLLALGVLPWAVLSRVGEWRVSIFPSIQGGPDANIAITARASVASDRVLFDKGGKRTDGTRHITATPSKALASHTLLPSCEPSDRVPFMPMEATSRYHSCRGPPASATACVFHPKLASAERCLH